MTSRPLLNALFHSNTFVRDKDSPKHFPSRDYIGKRNFQANPFNFVSNTHLLTYADQISHIHKKVKIQGKIIFIEMDMLSSIFENVLK